MIHRLSSNTPRVGTVCGFLITTTIYSVFVTRRFEANWEQVSSELVKSHPELSEGDNLGILKRKWEYMYVYAEIGFAKAYTSCHFWTFTRPVSFLFFTLQLDTNHRGSQENIVTSCH